MPKSISRRPVHQQFETSLPRISVPGATHLSAFCRASDARVPSDTRLLQLDAICTLWPRPRGPSQTEADYIIFVCLRRARPSLVDGVSNWDVFALHHGGSCRHKAQAISELGTLGQGGE